MLEQLFETKTGMKMGSPEVAGTRFETKKRWRWWRLMKVAVGDG